MAFKSEQQTEVFETFKAQPVQHSLEEALNCPMTAEELECHYAITLGAVARLVAEGSDVILMVTHALYVASLVKSN